MVRISYWVNPTQPWIAEEQAIAAVRASFRTWETAVPSVRFEYVGRTVRPPTPADSYNVVGWVPWLPIEAAAAPVGGTPMEADIFLNLYKPWASYPCQQQDGSCTDQRHHLLSDWWLTGQLGAGDGPSPFTVLDVQNVVTHEVGHWLGLGDMYDEEARELTMYGFADALLLFDEFTERKKATLGLGDVLGARTLYPCGCPLPSLYTP